MTDDPTKVDELLKTLEKHVEEENGQMEIECGLQADNSKKSEKKKKGETPREITVQKGIGARTVDGNLKEKTYLRVI